MAKPATESSVHARKSERSPTVLIILDGWGHSESPEDNAIFAARTPTWDELWSKQPHTLIGGSGLDVGLPDGQMGNSEVGHMNLGAGRVVYQDFTRIGKAIEDGEFSGNEAFRDAFSALRTSGGRLHVMGLLSPGGVHSHEDHIEALLRLTADQGIPSYLHAFLDGRDTPPRSAEPSLAKFEALFAELGHGRLASLCGRYFAMDRDKRWDRVQAAYDLLNAGIAERRATSAVAGLQAAYAADESDEFVKPTWIDHSAAAQVADMPEAAIRDGDAILFMNFRADRARELSYAFTDPDFDGFTRTHKPKLAQYTTLTQYAADISARVAYPPESLGNTLGEYVSSQGLTQLRTAETEKYAHVTFFFNGGREETFPGEARKLIASPKVATYDLQPEMSAPELTDTLVEAITSGDYDLIVCNYANGDMVGHTGVFAAAVTAVETVDQSLQRICEALQSVDGQCLITADHGNVEQMRDDSTGQAHTAHTCEPVPLIYYGPRNELQFVHGGTLADIAPTLLTLMDLPQPAEMTGRTLVAGASAADPQLNNRKSA